MKFSKIVTSIVCVLLMSAMTVNAEESENSKDQIILYDEVVSAVADIKEAFSKNKVTRSYTSSGAAGNLFITLGLDTAKHSMIIHAHIPLNAWDESGTVIDEAFFSGLTMRNGVYIDADPNTTIELSHFPAGHKLTKSIWHLFDEGYNSHPPKSKADNPEKRKKTINLSREFEQRIAELYYFYKTTKKKYLSYFNSGNFTSIGVGDDNTLRSEINIHSRKVNERIPPVIYETETYFQLNQINLDCPLVNVGPNSNSSVNLSMGMTVMPGVKHYNKLQEMYNAGVNWGKTADSKDKN